MAIDERNNAEVRLQLSVTRREWRVLRKLAEKEEVDPLEYISNIVRGFCNNQLQGKYRDRFNKMNVLEYANLFGDVMSDGELNWLPSAVQREKKKVYDKYGDKIKDKEKD
jgi:hypothetical protein